MSSLSKQPPKVIALIAKNCFFKDFDFEDPYDDIETNFEILKSSSNWADSNVSFSDLEFMAKFLQLNVNTLTPWFDKEIKFEEVSKKLIYPKSKKFVVKYSVHGIGKVTEYMETEWDSYDQNWVESSIKQSEYDGEFFWGDGNFIRTEVDDFEWDHIDYDRIFLLEEQKKGNIMSKLVLENNLEVINDLDKKTLIDLRDLINQRLSSI